MTSYARPGRLFKTQTGGYSRRSTAFVGNTGSNNSMGSSPAKGGPAAEDDDDDSDEEENEEAEEDTAPPQTAATVGFTFRPGKAAK